MTRRIFAKPFEHVRLIEASHPTKKWIRLTIDRHGTFFPRGGHVVIEGIHYVIKRRLASAGIIYVKPL